MIPLLEDPRLRSWLRLWAVILAGSCAAMAVVVIGSLWVLNGFHGVGVDATTLIALLAGTILSTALGVALMGLVFYSDMSGADEAVRDASTEDHRPDGVRGPSGPPPRRL